MSTTSPSGGRTGLRVGVVLLAAATVAAALVAGGVTSSLAAQASPAELTQRLAELEQQVPTLPPQSVQISEDQTWAEFPGNYRGTNVQLEELAPQARDLFVDASDADGEVAAAVADAARGLLVLQQGYELLARWEDADLQFPVGGTDAEGVATGADARYGTAEAGLRLLLDGRDRRQPAFGTLADAGVPSQEARQLFGSRLDVLQGFELNLRPDIKRALSLPTTQQVVPVQRFETDAPGNQARARSMTFVCVPRDLPGTGDAQAGQPPAVDLRQLAATLPAEVAPADDCTQLADANTVQPAGS